MLTKTYHCVCCDFGGLAGVAAVAQLVECVLGKDEVKGSIPFSSSGYGFLGPSPLAAGLGSCGMSARPEGVRRDG
jgi:hypothetical protein